MFLINTSYKKQMKKLTIKRINRKVAVLLLIIIAVLSMSACGSEKTLSGKYYKENTDDIYIEFDKNSLARLTIEGVGTAVYTYAINPEFSEMVDDEGAVHKTYIVHLSDTNSEAVRKMVYDSKLNVIWEEELGLYRKK